MISSGSSSAQSPRHNAAGGTAATARCRARQGRGRSSRDARAPGASALSSLRGRRALPGPRAASPGAPPCHRAPRPVTAAPGDDDNYVNLSQLAPFLGRLDAGVPLFLTSRVGPGRTIQAACAGGAFAAQKHLNISCCGLKRNEGAQACAHNALRQPTDAVASHFGRERCDKGGRCTGALPVSVPVPCDPVPQFEHGCCASRASFFRGAPREPRGRLSADPRASLGPIEAAPPQLVAEGYPWKISLASPRGPGFTPFYVPPMWAYGGAGYVFSRGLAETVIGADGWRLCRERIVCHNADVRVTKCVHNYGHGVTLTPPGVQVASKHHIHDAALVTAAWRAEQAAYPTAAAGAPAEKTRHQRGRRGRRRST